MKFKFSVALLLLFILCAANRCDDGWRENYGDKLHLVDIEPHNLDNSGEYPIKSNAPIRKEAYMIGLRYKVVEEPNLADTLYLSDLEQYRYYYIGKNKFQIFCNEPFNNLPEGANVTDLFSLSQRNALYETILVLRVAPQAGEYSFDIELTPDSGKVIKTRTDKIKLY